MSATAAHSPQNSACGESASAVKLPCVASKNAPSSASASAAASRLGGRRRARRQTHSRISACPVYCRTVAVALLE